MTGITAVQPQDLHWRTFDAFSRAVRIAFVVGRPGQPGPRVVRVRVSGGVKLPPHRNPVDQIYTVIEGTLFIGHGERFDEAALVAYPAGSVLIVPGGGSRYTWAKFGDYVVQMTDAPTTFRAG